MNQHDDNTPTADLTTSEKLDRILAEMGEMKARLSALEAQGTGTTRPLLDQIIKEMVTTREALTERIGAIEKQLRGIDRRFAVFAEDVTRMRADVGDFDERLTELERRPN